MAVEKGTLKQNNRKAVLIQSIIFNAFYLPRDQTNVEFCKIFFYLTLNDFSRKGFIVTVCKKKEIVSFRECFARRNRP